MRLSGTGCFNCLAVTVEAQKSPFQPLTLNRALGGGELNWK
jgi:hypothetical protein